MKINDFFNKEYLTPGIAYDNFIFEDCPKNFLDLAKSKLNENVGTAKPCIVYLNGEHEAIIEQTLNNCGEDLQKKILARDFIVALIIKQILKYKAESAESASFVEEQLEAFFQNNFEKVKLLHGQSFMPYDIKRMSRDIGKIELIFVLEDTYNKNLQQAINMFISSREPYCVKIFTNNKILPTYYDLNGNIIESPHDFMRRNVNDFIENNSVFEKC